MCAHIKTVRILGYQPFKDVEFQLGKLNVVVGPNGSGKTSLLSYLDFEYCTPEDDMDGSYDYFCPSGTPYSGCLYIWARENPDIQAALDVAIRDVNLNYKKIEHLPDFSVITKSGRWIPSWELSQGTINYLNLVAFLARPIGIRLLDTPESELHPDLIVKLADRVVESLERGSQVVLTTNSYHLVDCLSPHIDAFITLNPTGEDTTEVEVYTKEYLDELLGCHPKEELSDLWCSGYMGGNLW